MRKLLDSPWFYFGLAATLLVAAIASQFRYKIPPRPVGTAEEIEALRERDDWSLLFVLIDTLRADRLGTYGYERNTSPALDELARTGIRFNHVEAQSSWTKASMASMWTGLYPQSTGILRYNHGLPDEARMPAEILQEAGFYTAGVYRNGWVAENFGFSQGFDLYVKPRANFNPKRVNRRSPNAAHPLKGSDLDLTESAIEFLRLRGQERFFLYIHYMDVHQYVYDSDSELFGTSFSDIYDNSIHWTDSNLNAVVRTLTNLGLRDKTIIVVAADHGEAFLEHGFEGHAKDLLREVQSTPLLISLPFALDPGLSIDTQVANVDIWPTLLDMLGLESLPNPDGRSLLPLILAKARGQSEDSVPEFVDRPVFSQIDRHWGKPQLGDNTYVAVVKQPYRFHRKMKAAHQNSLYDHSTDPLEETNVVREREEVVQQLSAEVDKYLAEGAPYWETSEVELDEMRLNQLRALGYAIEKP